MLEQLSEKLVSLTIGVIQGVVVTNLTHGYLNNNITSEDVGLSLGTTAMQVLYLNSASTTKTDAILCKVTTICTCITGISFLALKNIVQMRRNAVVEVQGVQEAQPVERPALVHIKLNLTRPLIFLKDNFFQVTLLIGTSYIAYKLYVMGKDTEQLRTDLNCLIVKSATVMGALKNFQTSVYNGNQIIISRMTTMIDSQDKDFKLFKDELFKTLTQGKMYPTSNRVAFYRHNPY
jgi:hypothetical protein